VNLPGKNKKENPFKEVLLKDGKSILVGRGVPK